MYKLFVQVDRVDPCIKMGEILKGETAGHGTDFIFKDTVKAIYIQNTALIHDPQDLSMSLGLSIAV